MPLHPPPNWEVNEIAKFFDAARSNEFATFANRTEEVARLSDIDLGYRKAIEGLNHSHDWFAGFFLLRAHSNYLGACRLCWSAQIPESYALLRSCLENALYGLYLANHPESRETWLRRHDDDADGQRDDGADLQEGGQVIPRRQQQPHRQHRGDEAVADQEPG